MKIRLAILSLAATLPIASTLFAQIAVPAAGTTPVRPATQKAVDGSAAKRAAAKIDEKANAIYEKGVAAARALKSIDVVTQMKFGGEAIDPGMLPPGFGAKSRVRMKFIEGEGGAKMFAGWVVIERLDGDKVVERFVAGKDEAILIMPEAKTYAKSEMVTDLLGVAAMAMPQWILEQRAAGSPNREQGGMVMPESKLLSAELMGPETIDDLECDVVKTVRELDMSSMIDGGDVPEGMPRTMKLAETIAFARADGLPRRISVMPVMEEMGGEDGMAMPVGPTLFWTALTANGEIADDVFSPAVPEGFTKVDPPENKAFGSVVIGEDAGGAARPEPALAVKPGDAAPDFKLTDLAGNEVTLASLKGKVVLLDFWATWCGPCKAAMPSMQKLHDEYGPKGVVILGVNTWEQKADAAKDYMASKKFTYGCLLKGDDLAKAYGVTGIPTLVVIGKDGTVALTEV
ncbi:MAG: TlpA family protein disulfide reductase, partial [Planctomycetota bacterium]